MPKPRTLHVHPAAKKRFGQNFLVDQNIIEKIAAAAGITQGTRVIEIGPGRGALTGELIAAGGVVKAVEIDRDLQSYLLEKFASVENFSLVPQDILQTRLEDVAAPKFKVVGNLPYNISTAILERLAGERQLFTDAVLMFQREVAERIAAPPNGAERGYLSVIAQAAFTIERLFDIGPQAFRPQPKVWSTVVRIVPRPENIFDRGEVRSLVSKGFSQRRKMLRNTLKGVAVSSEVLDLSRRAESLTLDEWSSLAETLN